MSTLNRTANPVRLQDYDEHTAYALQTGALQIAYLGDERGIIPVESNGSTAHYGQVYIRLPSTTNENGATVLGQAIEASVSPNVNFVYKTGLPVLVRKIGMNEQYRVVDVDEIAAARAGFNTHQLNPMHPANQLKWIRNLRDGKLFATGTVNTDSLTISVEPFLFWFDGVLYNGGKDNTIDLSSYMPGADLERLVVLGERATDRTIQIIAGSTRTITPVKYALSDIVALVAQFDDYVIPLGAVKLGDNAVTILEGDLHQDVRQMINVQQPRGFPNPITRQRVIISGYQALFSGGLEIDGGELVINGELAFV